METEWFALFVFVNICMTQDSNSLENKQNGAFSDGISVNDTAIISLDKVDILEVSLHKLL